MSKLLSLKALGAATVLAGLTFAAMGANATPAAPRSAVAAETGSAAIKVDRGHHGGGRLIIRPYGFYGGPYYGGPYYAYSGSHGRCGWLRERARDTGSRYWWRRYRECLDD